MEQTLLLHYLGLLSTAERNALGKFLRSPYHNARTDVVVLFEQCSLKKSPPDKETLFEAMYPGVPFQTKQFSYAVSYLTQLIEDFWAQEQYQKTAQEQALGLVEYLQERKADRFTERAIRQATGALHRTALRNADHFRRSYRLHNATLRSQLHGGRSRDLPIQPLTEAHEKAFFIEKLQLGCMGRSLRAVANTTVDEQFTEVIVGFLDGHPWLNEPVLSAWYNAYQMLGAHPQNGYFDTLKGILEQHGAAFSAGEKHDLFLVAVNYCIRRINSGDGAFAHALFEIYKNGLQQEVFLDNGTITRWTYNNIINAALKVQEMDWAMAFLEQYRPKLEPAHRDTSYYFNQARCWYERGNLPAALRALTRIEYDDILQNLSAKTLQIKIYYETASWQALDSLLDSMAIYIRRKKVLGYHKENYTNIVRFVRRLTALPPGDRASRAALREEVEACTGLLEKNWFLRFL